ncbi:DUF3619 family protein, partial [Pseudoxanthomonas koreensis]|uniref:DUF3619 family protein n=1 Tax=Pseudoxanthomonas koreensis TaxID=266061 RepID=UPI001390AD50
PDPHPPPSAAAYDGYKGQPLARAAELPAALAAFLRGAERRAFVFLWLQGGDATAAEKALAAAIRAFPGPAARMPMAEWPERYWKLLLALPVESAVDAAGWPPALAFLPALRLPVRRALLLRQVAGLDEAAAAAAMGLDLPAYQQALAEACPRDATGEADAAGWRAQAEAIQQAGRDLDAQQSLRLAQLREAALAGHALAPARDGAAAATRDDAIARPARTPPPPSPGPGRWRAVLFSILAVMALLAGLMARRFWPGTARTDAAAGVDVAAAVDDLRVHDNEPVVVEALPPAEAPALPADGPLPLPEPLQDPVIAELALLSWQAAGAPPPRIEREAGAPAGAGDPPASAAAFDDATLLDAWRQLDAVEQAQVHAAAAALQSQDPASQAQLRARFAALDAMERRGWLLGPALGADFFALQPLLGFVPEDERAPLLAVLRTLTPAQRARLGELAQRTPPAGREALRRELLATPPAQRGAWLEQRGRQ